MSSSALHSILPSSSSFCRCDEVRIRRTGAAVQNDRVSCCLRDLFDAMRVEFLLCAAAQDAVHVADGGSDEYQCPFRARTMPPAGGRSGLCRYPPGGASSTSKTRSYHAELAFYSNVASGCARVSDSFACLLTFSSTEDGCRRK